MTVEQKRRVLKNKVSITIATLRKEKGVTQETAYCDTGHHFARLEIGKVDPQVTTIASICDYFEITISEFFDKVESL